MNASRKPTNLPRQAAVALGLAALALGLAVGAVTWAQDVEPGFEGPPMLRAAEILPSKLYKTPYYTVADGVPTDGYFYHFSVQSHYGRYNVVSLEMLKVRAHEIEILNRAVELKDKYEFLNAAGGRIEAMGEALVGTVVHPVETVQAVTEGVGKKIASIGRLFKGRKRSKRRDSFVKELLLAKHKRRVAYELEVDVYSSNPQIQDLLDSIATQRAAGQAAVDLGAIFVPGAAGVVVSIGKFEANMKGLLLQKSAGELVGMNNDKLERMGVEPELRKRFINQTEYSPRHQTYLVGALEQMRGVRNRGAFLRAALHAKDEASALYYQKTAELLAQYHLRERPIQQLASAGRLPVAYLADGTMIIAPPFDYIYWDARALKDLEALSELDRGFSRRRRMLVTIGRLSPRARQGFQRWGFLTREDYHVSL